MATKKKTQKKQAKKTATKKTPAKKKAGKNKVGRRRLLDKPFLGKQKKLIESLKKGHYVETACALAGISVATYYNWLNRGEAELTRVQEELNSGVENPEFNDDETVFVEFLEAVTYANAHAEDKALGVIQDAFGEKDWRAAINFLERRFFTRWRKRSSTELSGPNGGPISTINTNVDVADDMDAQKAAELYQNMLKNVNDL